MVRIVYYSWANTADNHAGMAYLVRTLKSEFPMHISLFEIPQRLYSWPYLLQRIYSYYTVWLLKIRIKKNDQVLFMEFLGNRSGNQAGMAMKLRAMGVQNYFSGLVHLPGKSLLELYGDSMYIKEAATAVDRILTFGSSLTDFFNNYGFRDKTLTTFHYVDTDFYKPKKIDKYLDKLHVVHIGSLKRNFKRLKAIVSMNQNIQFHICQGNNDLSGLFSGEDNVILYGFLEETELRLLMQSCQVSLSILEDTVGSNVITTSLACGLVNVVSDVGSIRDYCTIENSILCKTDNDFTIALQQLNENRNFLLQLQKNALKAAPEFSLQNFKATFKDIFLD